MAWYAIRTVYHFGVKNDGTNIFEERIVCFRADSDELAHDRARQEADEYASEHGLVAHNDQSGYRLDDGDLVDGFEVWSECFESRLSLDAFVRDRYRRFDYAPD